MSGFVTLSDSIGYCTSRIVAIILLVLIIYV